MIYNHILAEKKRIENKIQTTQVTLKCFPDGDFYCNRNGKYTKWMYNDGQGPVYLPKSQQEFAEKILIKKYLSLQLKDLQFDKENIDHYLNQITNAPCHANSFISSNTEYSKLLSNYLSKSSSEFISWMKEPYQTNPQHPEKLIHQTSFGLLVRSKSEAIIATSLHTNQIPFRYECELPLGFQTLYPDFTIRHPQTGKIYYWEHFGLMDDPTYIQKTFSKQQTYASYGIIPSINLITTYETSDSPLSAQYIETMINHYFL